MRRFALALILLACSPGVTEPSIEHTEPFYRILTAVDSLNFALREFHAQGGRLTHVYTINFPADSNMAPVVAISLRRP